WPWCCMWCCRSWWLPSGHPVTISPRGRACRPPCAGASEPHSSGDFVRGTLSTSAASRCGYGPEDRAGPAGHARRAWSTRHEGKDYRLAMEGSKRGHGAVPAARVEQLGQVDRPYPGEVLELGATRETVRQDHRVRAGGAHRREQVVLGDRDGHLVVPLLHPE